MEPLENPRQHSSSDRTFYLPRLPRDYYQGDAIVHWTLSISNRKRGWLNPEFHVTFRELMLHSAAREGLMCPVYCLMPDHLHLVWMGLRIDTDQWNGMAFLRTHLEPALRSTKFQPQAHDHVIREKDRQKNAFAKICFYIAANPVRAELADSPDAWPFTGCVMPGYPKLHPLEDGYWEKFWKLYSQARENDAGDSVRPPIGSRAK